jgi:ribonuclease P protein component
VRSRPGLASMAARLPMAPESNSGLPRADCIMSDPGVPHHEANVPTQKATPAPRPRVSGPDGDAGRPERPQVSPAQGPQSPHADRPPVCVKRRARLVRRSEFDRALAGRASASSAYLALFVGNNGLGHPRVGFAVSRKLGNAVVRNRIKRRLRDLVRPMAERTQAGRDVVIVARARAVDADAARLRDELQALWAKSVGA